MALVPGRSHSTDVPGPRQSGFLPTSSTCATVFVVLGSHLKRIGLGAVVALGLTASLASATSSTVLTTTSKLNHGNVVVNSSHLALYGFSKDSKTSSACTGTCTQTWMPVLTKGTVVQSGSGLSQKLVAKIKLPNGTYQATYGGHPLYRYVGDMKVGQKNGAGKKQFSGTWYLVSKTGKFVIPLVGGYNG
jgi:predicted lipoprotein with Yx(FWY)xxD motif